MHEITRLEKVIHHFRTYISKDITSLHIGIFLSVAESPGITIPELMQEHNTNQEAIKSGIRLLSRHQILINGKIYFNGHDLLEVRPTTEGDQSLAVDLTYNGKFLLHEIQDIMNEGNLSMGHGTRKLALVMKNPRTGNTSTSAVQDKQING